MKDEPVGLAVFLLAHPDDDVFMRPLISRAILKGQLCRILIMTNATLQMHRKVELEAAVETYGADCELVFIGESVTIPDGQALEHLDVAFHAVKSDLDDQLNKNRRLLSLYTHAWEFGHPDHDAVHLVGNAITRHFGIKNALSITYYRSSSFFWKLDVQASHLYQSYEQPLALSLRERIDLLMSVRHYPSQWRTFFGLWPFMLLRTGLVGRIHVARLSDSIAPAIPKAAVSLCGMSQNRFGTPISHTRNRAIAFLDNLSDKNSNLDKIRS